MCNKYFVFSINLVIIFMFSVNVNAATYYDAEGGFFSGEVSSSVSAVFGCDMYSSFDSDGSVEANCITLCSYSSSKGVLQYTYDLSSNKVVVQGLYYGDFALGFVGYVMETNVSFSTSLFQENGCPSEAYFSTGWDWSGYGNGSSCIPFTSSYCSASKYSDYTVFKLNYSFEDHLTSYYLSSSNTLNHGANSIIYYAITNSVSYYSNSLEAYDASIKNNSIDCTDYYDYALELYEGTLSNFELEITDLFSEGIVSYVGQNEVIPTVILNSSAYDAVYTNTSDTLIAIAIDDFLSQFSAEDAYAKVENMCIQYDDEGWEELLETAGSEYYLESEFINQSDDFIGNIYDHFSNLDISELLPLDVNCETILGDTTDPTDTAYYLQLALNVIKYAGIIALLGMTILDYTKAVAESDADGLKKANLRTIKRLAYTVLLFLFPIILEYVFVLVGIYTDTTDPFCGIS